MKKRNNHLDEMQEQKLLKIEHNGVWFAFWALLAAILVQQIIYGEDVLRHIAGEWIVFMCLAVYLIVACLKNGIWDRKLRPNNKTNVIVSMIAGLACGVVSFVSSYVKYHKLAGSIATGLFLFIFTFILSFAALGISMALYKKRVQKLEDENNDRKK